MSPTDALARSVAGTALDILDAPDNHPIVSDQGGTGVARRLDDALNYIQLTLTYGRWSKDDPLRAQLSDAAEALANALEIDNLGGPDADDERRARHGARRTWTRAEYDASIKAARHLFASLVGRSEEAE